MVLGPITVSVLEFIRCATRAEQGVGDSAADLLSDLRAGILVGVGHTESNGPLRSWPGSGSPLGFWRVRAVRPAVHRLGCPWTEVIQTVQGADFDRG